MPTSEGTINFWLKHEHQDWWSNNQGYNFGDVKQDGLVVTAAKHPDKTIELTISGPSGKTFVFKHPVPECGAKGLMVTVTWSSKQVILYLNSQQVETHSIPE